MRSLWPPRWAYATRHCDSGHQAAIPLSQTIGSQGCAAGAGRGAEYGTGGVFGQPRSSFQSGYDLKAPPIGSTPQEQQTHDLSHRASQTQATVPQTHENDTESMTESEENPSYEGEDEDISPQEAWRYSKAERFFGIACSSALLAR